MINSFESRKEIIEVESSLFRMLEFSLTNYCNMKCEFCPTGNRNFIPRRAYLDMELFHKILYEVHDTDRNYNGMIVFSGFSEPLLHPDFKGMIITARMLLPKSYIIVNTNGLLLTERSATNDFVDSIRVSAYSLEMYDKWDGFSSQVQVIDRFSNLEFLNNRGGVYETKEDLPLKTECMYPHYSMTVDYDGRVMPCCQDFNKEGIIGDTNKESIIDIWYGENMRKFRENGRENSHCSKCDVRGDLAGFKKP